MSVEHIIIIVFYRKFLKEIIFIYLFNLNKLELNGLDNSICGSAMNLPFKNETWDIITSFDMIEHLKEPDAFLEEAFRVLKAGGIFIISTPNLSDFYSRLTFLFGYMPFNYTPSKHRVSVPISKVDTSMGHMSVFTYKGLNQLLSINGFHVIKSDGYVYCDEFHVNKNPLSGKGVGLYTARRLINKILPISMREGMIFISQKSKGVGAPMQQSCGVCKAPLHEDGIR